MTERIQELAKQAGIWQPTFDHKTWVRGEYVASPGELEKFAKLIVRECIEVCNSRVGNSDYNTGRMHCVSDLKEHFGVKE